MAQLPTLVFGPDEIFLATSFFKECGLLEWSCPVVRERPKKMPSQAARTSEGMTLRENKQTENRITEPYPMTPPPQIRSETFYTKPFGKKVKFLQPATTLAGDEGRGRVDWLAEGDEAEKLTAL